MINTSAIHVDVQPTAIPLSLTSDLSDIPYIEEGETNNGYRISTNITPAQLTPSKSHGSMTTMGTPTTIKKSGFPLTKLKSQFKPAQLTLSTVPIDQGTKDVDKQLTSSKQTNINTGDTNPHSVPIMTGLLFALNFFFLLRKKLLFSISFIVLTHHTIPSLIHSRFVLFCLVSLVEIALINHDTN